ncbi:DNA-binding protein inhibitor ID-2-like [Mercenaria mercenaria]|uniref:DNA-binding protein inhibitor ID-2-like n=1 Tax=Mercenaria mercenaria TaxID=6596 RepID=UPI001E1DE1A0|nr:DNA-binding protein inhibitor ID-2-like [Mercenaria mercenaria]
MKAVTQGLTRNTEIGLKGDMFRINKPKLDDGEMAACFLKLKELVPGIPDDKKISKTQLLQHVIDYIYDLELSLDFQPVVFNSTPREPLMEKAAPNHTENIVSMEDSDSEIERPVSK